MTTARQDWLRRLGIEDTDTRRADSDLRHETATLLQDLADRVRAGQVRRWQIETALPSLRMCAHVLREVPRKGTSNGG